MSTEALKTALEELADPMYCEGKYRLTDRLAIQLPDGDVGALDDKTFVAWLLEHSEDAPFGFNGETKVDKKVRHAKRLVARGKADVSGFDVAAVLGEIEAALSPLTHLEAKLEDVIVYPKGGKFTRHKDTPRTPNLVGTLVVGLPGDYEGGELEIYNRGSSKLITWKGLDKSVLGWAAVFSDVDHGVREVLSGNRITLVYSLSRTDRPRTDPTRDKRLEKVRRAAAQLKLQDKEPLMIACTRQIITDGKQPQSVDALRGADREIAEVLLEAGFGVTVRSCLVVSEDALPDPERSGFPTVSWAITRLKKAIPEAVVKNMDYVVSFTDSAVADEEGDFGATLLGDYCLDFVMMDRWIVRKRAASTYVHQGLISETGYFGNEASDGYLYTLAALEVTPGKTKAKAKAKPKAAAKPKPKAKPKAKAKAKPKAKKR